MPDIADLQTRIAPVLLPSVNRLADIRAQYDPQGVFDHGFH
ncbi:hypothetical protein [Diaminobutyricimonas sp. LJ205]|nr:hypothetical protein [Diaminobutyricimonas sp. LJ205]